MMMAVGAVSLASVRGWPTRLVYNPTASAPVGWYAITPEQPIEPGDLVLTYLPEPVARFADQRRYLPATVPLLKPIAAISGDTVCSVHGDIAINGERKAKALTRDGRGRRLTPWSGCRALQRHEVFLLSHDSPSSFDSRYFGPIDGALIVGRAGPLWTW